MRSWVSAGVHSVGGVSIPKSTVEMMRWDGKRTADLRDDCWKEGRESIKCD